MSLIQAKPGRVLSPRSATIRPMIPARRRDLGIFWLLSALWSGNWLWIKIGLAGLPPFRFAGLRLALACVLLAPFVLRRPRPTVSPGVARWSALVGFLLIGGAG